MVNRMHDTFLTDLCYGYVAFHRRCLPYLDLTRPGFEVETSLTVSALRAGLRIAEVPSMEMPRRYGRSNLHVVRDGTRVLRTLLREHDRGPAATPSSGCAAWSTSATRPGAPSTAPSWTDPGEVLT